MKNCNFFLFVSSLPNNAYILISFSVVSNLIEISESTSYLSWFPNVEWFFILRENCRSFAYLFSIIDKLDYYVHLCSISHVQAMGRSISPEFDVKIHHPSGKCTLKYCPQIDCYVSSSTSSQRSDSSNPSRLRTITSNIMQRGVRRWEQFLLSALLGTATDPVVVDNDDQWKINVSN